MITVEDRFASEEELKQRLRVLGVPTESTVEVIAHERAHFEKALDLGYSPSYSLFTCYHRSYFTLRFATFVPKNTTREDLILIASAPDIPGPEDLELIKKVREQTRRQQT